MATLNENENPVFNEHTLRLVVGALAFGLPSLVYILAGRITTSISSSYHEPLARDVFVGSLFVIGTLLISYKGHLQGEPPEDGVGLWSWFWSFKWINRYQENLISTIGGVAAMTAALFPTACETCSMDRIALVHTVSAFLLFANVAYFSIVAFLRSVNNKLLNYKIFKDDIGFTDKVNALRKNKTQRTFNPLRFLWNFLTLEFQVFLAIRRKQLEQYEGDNALMRFARLWTVHGKKFARGFVYVVFGSLTLLVLLVYVILGLLIALKVIPDILTGTTTTFVIEAVAMSFFGVTWITASQLQYWRQIRGFVERFWPKPPAVPEGSQPDPA